MERVWKAGIRSAEAVEAETTARNPVVRNCNGRLRFK